MAHREFKDRLYAEFARISQALASERRLEVVDLLAQSPRRVEALAAETGMTLANVSQHLQVLRNARLVESERQGTSVIYRLASTAVMRLWLSLRDVAAERLPEIDRLREEYAGAADPELARDELEGLLKKRAAVLLDVRPAMEFEHGHIDGAVSIPLDELEARLRELPKSKRIVAYCRGAYCLFADEAVAVLRDHGYDAVRLEGGWPEWAAGEGSGKGDARSGMVRAGAGKASRGERQ